MSSRQPNRTRLAEVSISIVSQHNATLFKVDISLTGPELCLSLIYWIVFSLECIGHAIVSNVLGVL